MQQIQTAMEMVKSIPPQMMAQNITPFTIDLYEAVKEGFNATGIRNSDRILVKLDQQQALPAPMPQPGQPDEMAQLANVGYGGAF